MFTKEDYVSLETAKILKEKGFDEYCGAYYHLNCDDMTEDECFEVATDNDFKNSNNVYRVGAPTLYEAQKWLWENHKMFVSAAPDSPFTVPLEFFFWIDFPTETINVFDSLITGEHFSSFQQALDAGIRGALKLI